MEKALNLEDLRGQRFSFYPPIQGFAMNEWGLEEASWSEFGVRNAAGGDVVWIPKQYLGEVSAVEDPVRIVGLRRELRYEAGSVWPVGRRALPTEQLQVESKAVVEGPVGVVAARSHASESGIVQLLAYVLGGLLVVGGLVAGVSWLRVRDQRFESVMQVETGLEAKDDHEMVVAKLGKPLKVTWSSPEKALQVERLEYGDKVAVLVGPSRKDVRYVGMLDRQGRTIHSVKLDRGQDAGDLLRVLGKE